MKIKKDTTLIPLGTISQMYFFLRLQTSSAHRPSVVRVPQSCSVTLRGPLGSPGAQLRACQGLVRRLTVVQSVHLKVPSVAWSLRPGKKKVKKKGGKVKGDEKNLVLKTKTHKRCQPKRSKSHIKYKVHFSFSKHNFNTRCFLFSMFGKKLAKQKKKIKREICMK